ncbi:MAG: hypothetical protein OXI06_08780 [bacterium]|nr:hypothetical protein [bacterium]
MKRHQKKLCRAAGGILLALLVAWTACNPDSHSGEATTTAPSTSLEAQRGGTSSTDWLQEVDTSTLLGLLAVLDEASIDRVNAILQDELDPAWRTKLESGELTLELEELHYWRRLARADVTTPLTDAEAAYLQHARKRVSTFQDMLLEEHGDPELQQLLGKAQGEVQEQD